LRFTIGDAVGIVFAAIVLIGGLLPWASVTIAPQIEGATPQPTIWWGYRHEGGVITMILALISLAVIAITKRAVPKRVAIASMGGLIFSVAFFYYSGVTSMMVECSRPNVGIGLVMSLTGGLGLVASIALMRTQGRAIPTRTLYKDSSI